MSIKQHEAVRLIRAISDCVQTHPQLTEDEPGGYCTEADQLMDEAAALLRVWSVDIERKDALLRQAVELIGSFSAIDICETQHHKKADQHSHIAQCPVAERFRAVWFAIKQELSQ